MKKLILTACVCALMLAGPLTAVAGDGASAFEKLKTLVGDWETQSHEGETVRANYRVTSAGSVVVETMMPGGPMEMVTLFHPDGDSVVATHYCAGQNQPRMKASGLAADGKEIAFKFLDVTNLVSPDAEHMREVTIKFQDEDHFSAQWISRTAGKDTSMTFAFTRVK